MSYPRPRSAVTRLCALAHRACLRLRITAGELARMRLGTPKASAVAILSPGSRKRREARTASRTNAGAPVRPRRVPVSPHADTVACASRRPDVPAGSSTPVYERSLTAGAKRQRTCGIPRTADAVVSNHVSNRPRTPHGQAKVDRNHKPRAGVRQSYTTRGHARQAWMRLGSSAG
jgi:hypothetical protein